MNRHTPPTAGLYTLGCKVNQYESEAIAEALTARGFTVLPADEPCDLYIVNTCTVTAESDRKARQFIRRALSHNPNAYLLVTGCMAQTSPGAIAKIPGVDFICGNREKLAVVEEACRLVAAGKKADTPRVFVPSLAGAAFEPMAICRFARTRAYIKIEDGCENHCTYCAIPAARGGVRSKPQADVLREVEELTRAGCREIVLTGIETASWGRDLPDANLGDLLAAVAAVPGVGRIRLGSLDPSLMRQPFVDKIAPLHALAPHFHLSMQSGSDRVLAGMKRKYNRTQALEAIARLRAAIPGVQFTTDMIVGFPGETEEDFEATLDFARRARFLMIHVFPYSRRAGTPADTLPHQLPEALKHARVAALSSLAADVRRAILTEIIGRAAPVEVLFETYDAETGVATGHTPDFIEVSAPSPHPLHAQSRAVKLTDITPDGTGCVGELIFPEEV